MRSLILFRHGKSDWDAVYETDHDRPLAERGREAARCMGRLLEQTHQIPGLAVASSAVRARDTLQLAARAGRWHCPMRIDGALYERSADEVLDWLRHLDANPESLLLTGHEPTWSDFAGRLIGQIGQARLRIPTGAMLRIEFDIDDWQAIEFGGGELRWLIPPKLIQKIRTDS